MNGTPGKIFQCPICQHYPSLIFRCTDCGEVRCSNQHCTGSEESGHARLAADATRCRNCHSGFYRRLSFHSVEMRTFTTAYRAKMEKPIPLETLFFHAA